MVWVLITLASILAITKGFPSCMVETNSIVCSFENETEEKEIEIIHYHSNDTDGSLLVRCELHRLKTCCTDNECSIVNINGTVNIMINIKDYSGKIGCFLVPSTKNSFNICNLTGAPVQRILDSVHHNSQQPVIIYFLVALVVIVFVMVIVAMALRKRRQYADKQDDDALMFKSMITQNKQVTVLLQ